jgi:1-acyl-sn-glycerol-3-phosphate acyltransferase
MTAEFDDIRPFNDDEVTLVLKRVLSDPEMHAAIGAWVAPGFNRKAPWLLHLLLRLGLAWQFRGIRRVEDFQPRLRGYLKRILDKSVAELTVSGLDKLDPDKGYLFVSNHRDIVMDPALVNWTLYHGGLQTVRIAIGDNLLSKPFVSDLMRLNKSFIVRRSVRGMKAKLKEAQILSRYIHHCITSDQHNVWIAQREGRAKDGYDKTNSAVIGMFSLSKPKDRDYGSYIRELNIVPVTISYEVDPLDQSKARELYAQEHKGGYKKRANEDVQSIARGMTGWKGRVHLAFGDVLDGDFEKDTDVAAAIDAQVHQHYRLYESNEWAHATLHGEKATPEGVEAKKLADRVATTRDTLKPYVLRQYANAVNMKKGLPAMTSQMDAQTTQVDAQDADG